MIVSAFLGAIASGIALAVTPFLFVSDTVDAALIAGAFSIINTALNLMIRRDAKQAKELAAKNVNQVSDVHAIVERRHDQETPHPHRRDED